MMNTDESMGKFPPANRLLQDMSKLSLDDSLEKRKIAAYGLNNKLTTQNRDLLDFIDNSNRSNEKQNEHPPSYHFSQA